MQEYLNYMGDVYQDFKKRNELDDLEDLNGDGIPDVQEMESKGALIQRK